MLRPPCLSPQNTLRDLGMQRVAIVARLSHPDAASSPNSCAKRAPIAVDQMLTIASIHRILVMLRGSSDTLHLLCGVCGDAALQPTTHICIPPLSLTMEWRH